ncbi:MAG: YHS domain-containing protein [Patescibacteria group bacterium]
MLYIDPVCKKKLRRKEKYAILKFGGNVYHLCCKTCKEEFQKSQIQYILDGKLRAERNNKEK